MKRPLWQISLLQSVGVFGYFSFAAWFMLNAEKWFGKLGGWVGPLLFLTFFGSSVLICALLVFSYPFLLWTAKKPKKALRLVVYVAGWLVSFGAGIIGYLIIY